MRRKSEELKSLEFSVERFGKVMVSRLARKKNRRKGEWKDSSIEYLFRRLLEEVSELYATHHEDVSFENFTAMECADVANFAMMIAERAKSTNWLILHDGKMRS